MGSQRRISDTDESRWSSHLIRRAQGSERRVVRPWDHCRDLHLPNDWQLIPIGRRGATIYELLQTKAPSPARAVPYCCYSRSIIFYHRPYILDWTGRRFVEYDHIQTRLHTEHGPHVVAGGRRYKISGGRVVWMQGHWWKMWGARIVSGPSHRHWVERPGRHHK